MNYLPNLSHDIFVSYAHVDNRPDRADEKGWVDQFEEQLYTQLLKVTGKEMDIWRDHELARAEKFDPVIEKAIRDSGIMIAMITNRYIEAEYCKKEVEWFCDKAREESAGLQIENTPRVIPVLLYNLPFDAWPEVCRGTSGHMFHDVEDSQKDRNELGRPIDPRDAAFSKRLRVLVDEIWAVLKRMRAQVPTEADPHASEAGEGAFRVFLASAADDVLRDQTLLRRELEKEGIEVLERVPPPWEESEHEKATREAMDGSELSIHLLGDFPGKPVDEDSTDLEKTYPVVQASLAAEHAASQLILLPRGFRLDDIDKEYEAYRDFMHELLERPREGGRLEVVQTGWRRMAEQIIARKKKREAEIRRKKDRPPDAAGTAFIDLHVNDVSNASDLVSYLAKKRYSPLMIPSAEITPKSGMQVFEENLKKAELFIVVYGGVERNWVKERLNEAVKLVMGNDLMTQIGVYVAPPRKQPEELRFRLVDAVMDNTCGFHPETIESLLGRSADHP